MMLFALLLTFVASALAGTQCPPRENIYPCSCLALPQGKKILFTSVTCHRLPSTDAFSSIFPALRSMTIDHFYLYDSFWEANKLGAEDKQDLPANWIDLLKIKELEIVDTTLSSRFACNNRANCRNDITTRFTAVNSSSHEKICGLCGNGTTDLFSWTSCMKKLREFHFRHGKLTKVQANLFPVPMLQLAEIDLSYNSISAIENKALQNLRKLKVLKLSHNLLESLNGVAMTQLPELQELDVSWNMLSSLGPDFFATLPKIKIFVANNNYMMHLKEEEWKNIPNTLRNIDLRDNPIHCDCDIRWINSTMHINTIIQGHCSSPEDYENSLIRRASRMLNERCTDEGEIGTRMKRTKAPVTKAMFEPE